MAELLIGALAASGFIKLVHSVRGRGLFVPGWGWALTLAAFLYGVFVLEVVAAFLREGLLQGAAVMGTLLGFGLVVWGVLLARFVFRTSAREHPLPRTPAHGAAATPGARS